MANGIGGAVKSQIGGLVKHVGEAAVKTPLQLAGLDTGKASETVQTGSGVSAKFQQMQRQQQAQAQINQLKQKEAQDKQEKLNTVRKYLQDLMNPQQEMPKMSVYEQKMKELKEQEEELEKLKAMQKDLPQSTSKPKKGLPPGKASAGERKINKKSG